mgnify:CR=1 FL=1
MIDLRSDTVTRPSREMLDAMLRATVGDDVYGEDPTVNDLQDFVASLFGKESALFVPTGTMSNQICLNLLTKPGEEIIADADAHIFYYENAAPARLSGVQIFPIKSERGEMPIEEILEAIRPNIYYFPRTSVIAIENTHNRHGGTIISLEYIQKIYEIAKDHNIAMHLDGARIWNAHVITKIPLSEYAKYFDTISVCFSKGLGAPIGSMLISTKENINRAWKIRKTFGGGMRQVGLIAAAAKFALINNLHKLIDDHKKAVAFTLLVNKSGLFSIDESKVETNIVVIDKKVDIPMDILISKLKENGLLISALNEKRLRAVFHLDVSFHDASDAANILVNTANQLLEQQ